MNFNVNLFAQFFSAFMPILQNFMIGQSNTGIFNNGYQNNSAYTNTNSLFNFNQQTQKPTAYMSWTDQYKSIASTKGSASAFYEMWYGDD